MPSNGYALRFKQEPWPLSFTCRTWHLLDSTVSQLESLVNRKGFSPYRPNAFALGLGSTVSQSNLLVKPLFIKAWCIAALASIPG